MKKIIIGFLATIITYLICFGILILSCEYLNVPRMQYSGAVIVTSFVLSIIVGVLIGSDWGEKE